MYCDKQGENWLIWLPFFLGEKKCISIGFIFRPKENESRLLAQCHAGWSLPFLEGQGTCVEPTEAEEGALCQERAIHCAKAPHLLWKPSLLVSIAQLF